MVVDESSLMEKEGARDDRLAAQHVMTERQDGDEKVSDVERRIVVEFHQLPVDAPEVVPRVQESAHLLQQRLAGQENQVVLEFERSSVFSHEVRKLEADLVDFIYRVVRESILLALNKL